MSWTFQDGRVHALYSTPSIYTDAKHASNESWPVKYDDYFPWVLKHNSITWNLYAKENKHEALLLYYTLQLCWFNKCLLDWVFYKPSNFQAICSSVQWVLPGITFAYFNFSSIWIMVLYKPCIKLLNNLETLHFLIGCSSNRIFGG